MINSCSNQLFIALKGRGILVKKDNERGREREKERKKKEREIRLSERGGE